MIDYLHASFMLFPFTVTFDTIVLWIQTEKRYYEGKRLLSGSVKRECESEKRTDILPDVKNRAIHYMIPNFDTDDHITYTDGAFETAKTNRIGFACKTRKSLSGLTMIEWNNFGKRTDQT